MKTRFIFLIFLAVFLFTGSSPWEGAGAVAPDGELPASGFFIATNSFPRNTVVDITNIETGRSTRAIVANTLNSPGLLAIVSREAAELLGMRAGSVTRIRMIQPSDPIAYLRFTESLTSGNPGFDSGNVIDEAALLAEVYGSDTYRPPITPPPSEAPSSPFVNGLTGPSYIMEPEWGGPGRMNIVDVPGFHVDPHVTVTESDPFEENRDTQIWEFQEQREIVKDVSPRIVEMSPTEVVKEVSDFSAGTFMAFDPEEGRDEIIKETGEFIVEEPRNEVIKDITEREVFVAEDFTHTQFTLVEAEEQPPPRDLYGINPEDIIPGIVIATPITPPERIITAVEEEIPPASVISPIVPAPSVPVPAPPIVSDNRFSVRTISHLDRGLYYVQVAALPLDAVENAVRQIDKSYDPVIFRDGSNMYRILIGPLNQGESAAVLARFKSIGYRDAFVRRGG